MVAFIKGFAVHWETDLQTNSYNNMTMCLLENLCKVELERGGGGPRAVLGQSEKASLRK